MPDAPVAGCAATSQCPTDSIFARFLRKGNLWPRAQTSHIAPRMTNVAGAEDATSRQISCIVIQSEQSGYIAALLENPRECEPPFCISGSSREQHRLRGGPDEGQPSCPAPRRCMSAPSAEQQHRDGRPSDGVQGLHAAPELHVDSQVATQQLASQAVAAALPFTEVQLPPVSCRKFKKAASCSCGRPARYLPNSCVRRAMKRCWMPASDWHCSDITCMCPDCECRGKRSTCLRARWRASRSTSRCTRWTPSRPGCRRWRTPDSRCRLRIATAQRAHQD